MRRRRSHLVCQHLELISRKVLEDFQDVIKRFVRRRHGIYALYRRNSLCYVGLAKDLRSRLNHHLRDRHAKTWDRFSVYLTIESDHLRELEALAIRIAAPKENRQRGKLAKSQNLKGLLRQSFLERRKNELNELFGDSRAGEIDSDSLNEISEGRKPALKGYFLKGQKIRWNYKNKIYNAHVLKSGTIRFQKKIFNSPSLAAAEVTKRGMNGWYCWKYERAPGDWVLLNELRK